MSPVTPEPMPSPHRRWPSGARLVWFCTAISLLLSVFAFAPRLWLLRTYLPGTFEWDRAHTFLLQCEHPFRRDVETAMLWRLLPPLVCHTLGLRGYGALALPWLGVVAATAYVALIHNRRCPHPWFVLGGTLLFATTSAVLVPVGWLGMNDAWCWLGLLVFAFGESPFARVTAVFLCPWVDERFIIGLPLALLVRWAERGPSFQFRESIAAFAWLPYAALRLALSFAADSGGRAQSFVHEGLKTAVVLVPWAPLAWWMGLRAAWAPAAYAMARRPPWLGLVAAATLIVCLLFASDMSRSAATLTPLTTLGGILFLRRHPEMAPRALLTAGIANLLIPAAHLTYIKFVPINNLLIELLRLRHTP